ncbi:hypothetical protein N431DRAFT_93273 [Stipitochalara longipes BDJ]|nr:hypothetical protein N431DRAFT_93273 [Stipitochalara longipes BDJ]
MNARSTATLEADFLELAEHFQLNIDHTKPEIIRRIVIKWFETQSCHRLRWLLILDGADDESFNLSDYFPPDSDNFGTVIITSRFSSSGRYHNLNRKCFEVNSMSDEDAKSLLIKTSDLDSDSWNDQPSSEDAQRLIRMLENLPLAIVQAGAWISGNTTLDPRQRLSRYIKLFNNHASRKKRGVLKVCWVTFELNINAIKEREPSWEGEVLQLFEFLTFLDQSGVSEFFFEATWDNLVRREFRKTELRGSKLSSYTKGQQLEVFSEIFSGVFDKSTTPKFEDEDHRVRKALKLLQRYGLVNLTFDTNSGKFLCLMHPIVHACSRDFMFPEDVKEIELRACLTLGASITWRYETKHRNVRRELLPHLDKFILALTSRKSELLEKLPRMEYYDLLLKFAKAYSEGGRFKEAEKLQSIVCNQLPPLKERSHDAQQPYSTSYTLLSQLFEFAIIFLWSSAPIIIALVSTLNYTEWIDYSQLELQRRKDQRNVHLMALKAWRELSNSEHDTDRPQGRQSALHHRELIVAEYETIQEYVKFLGVFDDDDREELERHIVDELCVSKMCLADSYSSMENRESTALELRQEVLETQKKRDPKAPERILEAMARTAQSHAKLRQTKEAIQMQKEILRARFKDDENFSTHNKVPCPEISHDQKPFGMGRNLIDAISNIAESFDASSELLLALDLRKEVLMEMKNIESEDHPDVLAAKTNLAITFEKLGFNESSMILRCQVHESWRTKAGDSHPRTLNAQLHRAKSFMKNSGSDSIPDIPSKQGGKEDETKQQGLAMAHEILTSVIAAYEKEPELYDEKDLQTAKSFLADCFSAQGDKAQALNLREQIYQFFHKTQGENARRTLEARDRFVNTYYSLARVTTKYPERQSYYTKAVIERIKLIEVQSGAGALHQWALPISWSRLADIYAKLADEADERNFLNETDSDDDYDNDNSSDNDDDIGIQLARVGEYQKTSTTSFKDSELSTLDADIETRDSPGSHRDCPDPGSFPQEGIFDRKGYELREHALRLYEYVVGELEGFDNEHQASTMARLAETLLATDLDENDIKAIELFRKAIKLRTRLVGASHSDTEALQRGLRSALASHNDGRSAFSNLEEVVDASRTKVDDFAALRSLGHFKRCGQHFSELLELGTGTV